MQKSVWSNFFLICKSMFILKVYSIQMLKFCSHKINGTTTVLLFLSRAAIHHSFTFNLQFLYELKHKVHPSKTLYEIFHFQYRFIIKVYIFVQQNAWTLWLQKVIIPFKIKTIEQPQTVLLPSTSDFQVTIRSIKIQWYLHELELSKNWPIDKCFKLRSVLRTSVFLHSYL